MSSAPGPEGLTIIVPARNEEERIGEAVAALRRDFPDAELIVVDGRSEDGTAERAEEAGAVVLRVERLGKGEALSAGERAASPGPLLLADADLHGSLRRLAGSDADLVVAAFTRRVGGGFGIAKRVASELVRLRAGVAPCEPLSGQRLVGARARAACFPLAPGFG
ncbi:MAG: glycosyltransferase, partial [Gaiellaceae bacterium]